MIHAVGVGSLGAVPDDPRDLPRAEGCGVVGGDVQLTVKPGTVGRIERQEQYVGIQVGGRLAGTVGRIDP